MTTQVCLVYNENNTVAQSGDGQPMLYVLSTTDNLPAGVTGSTAELIRKGYTDLSISARSRMYYNDLFGTGGETGYL